MIYVLLGCVSTLLALAITPLVRAAAVGCGIVDAPGGRRIHQGHVPRLGGIAVLLAGFGAVTMAEVTSSSVVDRLDGNVDLVWLLAGILVVSGVGIVDDTSTIGPVPKLALTTLAAILALAGRCGVDVITTPFTGSPVFLGSWGRVMTLVWIVGITNGFNLIDGLDGLAAGVGLIAAITILIVSIAQERSDVACLAVTLGGALLGFLYYNFSPASIFLGDSGSLPVGYLLSILSIQGHGKSPAAVVVLVPMLALGLPIMDTLVAVSRRYLLAGSSAVFHADREHIHHRLLRQGMTPRHAVLLLYAVSAMFAGLAILSFFNRGSGSAVIAGVGAFGSYIGLRHLGYRLLPAQTQ